MCSVLKRAAGRDTGHRWLLGLVICILSNIAQLRFLITHTVNPVVEGEHYMLPPREDWLHIAEQASKEMDPQKLMRLVKQLCSALDDKNKPHLPIEQDRG